MDIAEEEAEELSPDIFIGNIPRATSMARRDRNKPLVRLGFPIHDRIGGQRLDSMPRATEGAQELYDRVVNAVMEKKQNDSPVGYGYI